MPLGLAKPTLDSNSNGKASTPSANPIASAITGEFSKPLFSTSAPTNAFGGFGVSSTHERSKPTTEPRGFESAASSPAVLSEGAKQPASNASFPPAGPKTTSGPSFGSNSGGLFGSASAFGSSGQTSSSVNPTTSLFSPAPTKTTKDSEIRSLQTKAASPFGTG